MLQGVVPKVLRHMAKIRYFVELRMNLQLIVLKILSGVSCDEGGFVGFVLLESAFFVVRKSVRWWMFCVAGSGAQSTSAYG